MRAASSFSVGRVPRRCHVVAFLKRPLVTSEVAAAIEDGSFSGGGSEDGNLWRRIRRFPRQFELKSGQLQKPLAILGKVLEEKAEENYASLNLVSLLG